MYAKTLCSVLLSIWLTGCTGSGNNLLYAGFEAETEDQVPRFSLPGDPEGDRIDWNGRQVGRALPVRIDLKERTIENEDGEEETINTKWLETVSAAWDSDNRLIFLPNRSGELGNVYTIQWEGHLIIGSSSSHEVNIGVKTSPSLSSSHPIISFLMIPKRSGKIDVHLVDSSTGREGDKIGELREGTFHSITITINFEESNYIIVGGNIGSINSGEKPFSTTESPQAPYLQMRFVKPGDGVTTYSFEEVRIDKVR